MYSLERFEKEISVALYLEHYINVEEFLEYCKACPNYNKIWSCPPYDFNTEEYWKKYNKLTVVGYKINFEAGIDEKESMKIKSEVKDKMTKELFVMEEIEALKAKYGIKQVIITHLEEDWGKSYDDYVELEKEYEGIRFAYDGMEVEL